MATSSQMNTDLYDIIKLISILFLTVVMLLILCVCGCVDYDQHDKSEKEVDPSATTKC